MAGSPNATPCARIVARFVDDLGRVQQRLRRNAADVEADAAELGQRSTSVTLRPRSAARNAAV